ncbi:MAG: cache domain-containing protein, partial [Acidobacteriota bacterium]
MTETAGREAAPEQAKVRGGRARILYALLSVISITALVPLLVEAWKLIDINREALETSQREYQLQLAGSMAQRVDAYVDQALAQVRTMGEGFALASRLSGDSTLLEYLQNQRGLNGALDSRLLELRYYPAGGQRSVRSRRAPPEGDPIIDDLFKLARKEVLRGSEFTGEPIHLPSLGEPVLVVGASVRSQGRQRGVLVALMSLSEVWDAMVRDVVSGHTVYALNRGGELFAHSDPRRLGRGSGVKESELVQRFISSGGMLGETLPFTLVSGEAERDFLGAYMPTRRRWGLFVQAEEKLAYHTVQEMIDSTLKWAAITLVIALTASF